MCGVVESLSAAERAAVWTDHDASTAPPPPILSRRRAPRILSDYKERINRRTSDNWTFAKEREIIRRSPLRVVRNEAEPFCVLSRRRDVDSRARCGLDRGADRACPSPRGLSSVCVIFLTHTLGTGTRRPRVVYSVFCRREESVGVCVFVPAALRHTTAEIHNRAGRRGAV